MTLQVAGFRETLTTVLLTIRGGDAVDEAVQLNLEWMLGDRAGRRTAHNLVDSGRGAFVAKLEQASAREVERAMIRAVYEHTDGLDARVGIFDIPKQTADSVSPELNWSGAAFPRQRGAERTREYRHIIVTSKLLFGSLVLPGATAYVENRSRPDAALMEVLHTIWSVDPSARIAGLDLDVFDGHVSVALHESTSRAPVPLRLDRRLGYGSPRGPVAFSLTNNITSAILPDHPARDLLGLAVGRKGEWTDPVATEGLDRRVLVTATPKQVALQATDGTRVRAHVVRIQDDALRNELEPPRPTVLIAVTGAGTPDEAINLAIKTDMSTDQSPAIKEFLEARNAARVFRGQVHGRHHLSLDRAIASAAFAAYQFIRLERSARAAS